MAKLHGSIPGRKTNYDGYLIFKQKYVNILKSIAHLSKLVSMFSSFFGKVLVIKRAYSSIPKKKYEPYYFVKSLGLHGIMVALYEDISTISININIL